MDETTSPIPHKLIGVAVIWDEQRRVLIARRRPEGVLGGLWEFPGGKVEPGETVKDCIKREIWEELGIVIEVGRHLISVDHIYIHLHVTLVVHHCIHLTGIPKPIECDELCWVTLAEIDQFAFPKANEKIIKALKQRAEG